MREPVPSNALPGLPRRASGVVLHLTSLPGTHGSGDLGAEAHRFIDWLAAARQRVWQVLPMGPVGFGNSPYQSPSALAGNPLLIDLDALVRRGWLQAEAPPAFAADTVDFARVIPFRMARLRAAAAGFGRHATAADRQAFDRYADQHAHWLDDYALFMALKEAHGHAPWWLWPAPLREREPQALAAAKTALAVELDFWRFTQWCFDEQLDALRTHARQAGVQLMGDMPIFVAHDSVECWAERGLFRLDAAGQPTVVAGVPPDGYTPDGQRWGNPLYDWQRMADDGFAWWRLRLARALDQCDLLRIDHFRGFAGCWEIPAACPTARDGRWVDAPGVALFDTVFAALDGHAPGHTAARIAAEDLGTITPDVVALRERHGLPGMRIVYEGLIYGPDHPFLPQHHVPHMLAYTSTHDSDTVRGWWRGRPPAGRQLASTLLGLDAHDDQAPVHRAVHRAALSSVARLVLAPAQDLLGLGSEHRMNRPGVAEANWAWRCPADGLDASLAADLAALTTATDRDVR